MYMLQHTSDRGRFDHVYTSCGILIIRYNFESLNFFKFLKRLYLVADLLQGSFQFSVRLSEHAMIPTLISRMVVKLRGH